MKLWTGYGSEHSYKLVMIGVFSDAAKAKAVEAIIKRVADQVLEEEREGRLTRDWDAPARFSDEILELVKEINLYTLGPSEFEQFIYEYSLRVEDDTIVLETDEIDVSAFMKIMLDGGAKVEVYSAHDHPDETESGSGSLD